MSAPAQKVKEFSIIQGPFKGYRAREDITMLPPGILVRGSQNVLTNTAQRISKRKGYTVDGQTNETPTPITSSFDWTKIQNNDRHVRSYLGILQYRFVASDGTITWRDLETGFSSTNFNYVPFWSTSELFNVMLFVNGTPNIYEWSGGITTYASSTSNTITKQGTTTWTQEGFYSTGNINASTIAFVNSNPDTITDSAGGFIAAGFSPGQRIVVSGATTPANNGTFTVANVTAGVITISPTQSLSNEAAGASITITAVRQVVLNGVVYTYTGGENTTTLTGVTPSVTPGSAGDVIHQKIRITPNSAMLGMDTSFANDLIGNLDEQIFIGSTLSNYIYVSYLSGYCNYTFSLPRQPGEGAKKTLTGYARAFVNQEQSMYVSAGYDLWYQTEYAQTTTTTTVGGVAVSTVYEQIEFQQLKTTALQAAQTQTLTTKIQNNVVFLSNEPILNTLGRVSDILLTPQVTDISWPIVDDMNQYDFTDASVCYFRQYIYLSIPKAGLIRIYNMTNSSINDDGSKLHYWECPQTFPIARFSIIDGELYGQGYYVPETYKLFDGYRDRAYGVNGDTGHEIPASARFSFRNYAVRNYPKDMNAFFVEGYISPNTNLTIGIQYDIDGCATNTSYVLNGNDPQFVCISNDDNSLGKFPFGKQPLGGNIDVQNPNALPPKFRIIQTFPKVPFFEEQTYFESEGIDEQWELVAWGGNVGAATQGPVRITR